MFELVRAENGVSYLRSDMLTCRHGFSTRLGGVSTLPHTTSLNLGFGRGDDDDTVRENLRRFADALDMNAAHVIRRHQIHSAIVDTADESMRGEGYFVPSDAEGDGLVTKSADTPLSVTTADCVPILFEDPDAGIVGAVHAGWRGAAAGIAAECVRKMCKLGADVKNIRAAIGPAIHFCCYEVGDDFLASVTELAGADLAGRCIRQSGARLHADIVELNRLILLEAGVPDEQIDRSDFCTCCHPELFWSHRFTHGVRGAMLAVISL